MATSTDEPTSATPSADTAPAGFLPEVDALPPDSVLLHIGVHKTGTTAIQAALADARPVLVAHDVYYPGKRPAQHRAALSVLQRPWGWADRGAEPFDRSNFDAMAERVRRHEGRTVISSEFFCETSTESAREVVADLGGDNVHVVVTLRNLGALLPSSWQQYLKYGMVSSYFTWLENVFEDPGGSSMTPSFWLRMDHAAVIDRWLQAVGPDRLTVVILEDLDRAAVFRTFEQLLDLPAGTLESRMDLTSNRSLTAMESQLLLDLNRRVAQELPWEDYERFVRRGVARDLVEERRPPADEPRLYTPTWALEAAAQMGARAADSIRASGVRVVGNLEALGRVAPTGEHVDVDERSDIPVDIAVTALATVIERARQQAPGPAEVAKAPPTPSLWHRFLARGRARRTSRSSRAS